LVAQKVDNLVEPMVAMLAAHLVDLKDYKKVESKENKMADKMADKMVDLTAELMADSMVGRSGHK